MTKKDMEGILVDSLIEANTAFNIGLFGQSLKEKNNWNVKNWRDAISVYLTEKHGWEIGYSKSLSSDALEIILAEELKSFQSPAGASTVSQPLLSLIRNLVGSRRIESIEKKNY